jgi:hypothetical protein
VVQNRFVVDAVPSIVHSAIQLPLKQGTSLRRLAFQRDRFSDTLVTTRSGTLHRRCDLDGSAELSGRGSMNVEPYIIRLVVEILTNSMDDDIFRRTIGVTKMLLR